MNKNFSLREIAQRFPLLTTPRPIDAHKGLCGTLGIIGGTEGMSGAVVLAGGAALKSGCGKVWIGFHQSALPLPWLPDAPEIMLSTAATLQKRQDITAWVLGCGLGTDEAAKKLVMAMCSAPSPVLFDADALTLLAQLDVRLPEKRTMVLTPHPGEAARLLHTGISEIQNQRTEAAQSIAKKYRAWTVLKGHHSVIAAPDGSVRINDSGNPALATAGSGDVLAGIIGSLLAQKLPPAEAVQGGVWLHGAAADELAQEGIGIGLCASELALRVRGIRNRLLRASRAESV